MVAEAQQGFLIGAIAMIAPWPWTLYVIKPVNDRLLELELDQAGPGSRALIVKWGTLHAVRTGARCGRHRGLPLGPDGALGRTMPTDLPSESSRRRITPTRRR